MQMLTVTNSSTLTMSSREIAELTEKEHKTVMRDIRLMLKDLGHGTDLYLGQYSSNNRMYDEYNLPKRETLLLISGYMLHVRVKIVDRLDYLERNLSSKEDPAVLLARKVLQQDEEIKRLEITKAQINDKRTATIMGRLGNATKKIKSLEDKLQDVGSYLSITAAKLPQRVDTQMRSNVQSWRLLKQISSDMQLPPKKVQDQRYGEVLAYHIDVIDKFKDLYI